MMQMNTIQSKLMVFIHLLPRPEVPRSEVFWQESPLRLCAELEVYRDAVRDVQANHADGRQEGDGRICGVRIDLFDHVVHQRKQEGQRHHEPDGLGGRAVLLADLRPVSASRHAFVAGERVHHARERRDG